MPYPRRRSCALVLLASIVLIGFGMVASPDLNLATAISIYLFITLFVADKVGFTAASIVSVIATLNLEYFFAPPLFSFRVERPENWAALATFEGMSLMVSRLSHRARLHQHTLEKQNAEQKALYELCRDTLLLDWKQSPDQQLCSLIKRSFPLLGVALWNAYENTLSCQGETSNAEETVKGFFFSERNHDDTSNSTSFRMLYFGTRAVGALMLYGHSLDALCVNSITSIVAMAIERTRSLALEMNVEAERQSEQLRSALLDGLAHAFKTPLTTITIASSGMLEQEGLNDRQSGLVDMINREAVRLNDLTTRLLHMSNLEPTEFVLHEKVTDIQKLLDGVLEECAFQLKSKGVDLSIGSEIREIQCDPQVLSLALVQIVDNAAKYGSQDSRMRIFAEQKASETILRIHNEGSFIPPTERHKVFTRFYRSPAVKHRAPGTGLGLSIAQKAVEAHGGKISIESDLEAGTTFVVSIPNSTEGLTWRHRVLY